MTPYRKRMNPFILRMADDMEIRNLQAAQSTLTLSMSTSSAGISALT